MESLIRVFLAFICLSTIYVSPAKSSTDLSNLSGSLDRAVSWLVSKQNNDGSFGESTDISMQWQTSHEVLVALLATDDLSLVDTEALLVWYGLQGVSNTEFLSRAMLIEEALGVSDDYLTRLISNSNSDGGFGSYVQNDSNVYETAFALRALLKNTELSSTEVYSAIEYLRSQQQDDGGFQIEGNLASKVLSAYVLISLQPYLFQYDVASIVDSTKSYLLNFLQNEESLGAVDKWQLSLILLSVVPLTTDTSLYMDAVDQLIQGQEDNGSWQQDIYSTALATQLIKRLTSIDQTITPLTSIVKGKLVESFSQQPINSAIVRINDTEILTDAEGQFELTDLESGIQNIYYSADGYYDATQTIEITERSIFDVGTVQLSVVPTTAIIEGVITDRETATPLVGVQVTVAGSTITSITTDASGYYRLVVDPEALTISVEKTGYLALTANAELMAGTTAQFSPEMVLETEQAVSETRLKGSVIDQRSGINLSEVNITITNASDSSTIETISGESGYFDILGISEGSINIKFTLIGYQTVNIVVLVSPGIIVDLAAIHMMPETTIPNITISGRVVDANTMEGIPNAELQILEINFPSGDVGGSVKVYTDSDGNYTAESIEFKQMEVFVQATGYVSKFNTLNYVEVGDYKNDFNLAPYSSEGIEIVDFNTSQSSYKAYEDMIVNVSLNNKGSAAKAIFIQMHIVDEVGQSVQHFILSENSEVSAAGSVTLLQGTPVELSGVWNISIEPPGDYQIILTAFDSLTGQVLTQGVKYFSIEPSGYIESVTVLISPEISKVNAIETLRMVYQLNYLGNISNNYTLKYKVIDPDDVESFNGSIAVELNPTDFIKLINLQEDNYQFNLSGRYLFESSVIDQDVAIMPSWTTVAPSRRVEAEQTLTPVEVLPGQDRQVNVEVVLQGVDSE